MWRTLVELKQAGQQPKGLKKLILAVRFPIFRLLQPYFSALLDNQKILHENQSAIRQEQHALHENQQRLAKKLHDYTTTLSEKDLQAVVYRLTNIEEQLIKIQEQAEKVRQLSASYLREYLHE
jgi:hypothetical protein